MKEIQKKMIVLELNEFNKELLKTSSEKFKLPSLKKIMAYNESKTFSVDSYESDYLEPWSQWVTVHSGKRSSEHLVKHLGDVSNLKFSQVWEDLGKKGVTTGVWGVINGAYAKAENCKFFVPDPWTFSELAFPSRLSYLVDLPRYLVKNRKNLEFKKVASLLLCFLSILKNPHVIYSLIVHTPKLLVQVLKDGIKEYIFYSFFEYLVTLEFIREWKKDKPDISFVFLNTVAHIQHYYWDFSNNKNEDRFRYSMYFVEKSLHRVLNLKSDIVLYNGLSQTSTEKDPPWISYRPKDHDNFLKLLNVKYSRVEPLMSYDAILLFDSEKDLQQGRVILESLKINEKPLLLVENYKNDSLRLFYRLAFTDPVGENAIVATANQSFEFSEILTPITTRTGKHIPAGNIFSSLPIFPNVMENTEFSKLIHNYLVQAKDD
jgi:hypothetical protein